MSTKSPERSDPAPRPRPFVAINFALTWDGRISTRNRTPADFSSARDKRRMLEIRAEADALLVGKKTLAKDNMQMGLPAADLRARRLAKKKAAFPLRVIISNSGRLDARLRVFHHAFSPIVIFSTTRMPGALRRALGHYATLHLDDPPAVDLRAMLAKLHAEYRVRRLLCEGGATLFRSLLEADCVDEINLTLCPRLFGGDRAPTLTGLPGDFLPRTTVCTLKKMEVSAGECFLKYRIVRS